MTDHAAPRSLIIETSGRVGQVAITAGSHVLGVRRLDETRRHARDLVPAVAELLTAQGWRPRDLEVVIVSRGPGSYTGLRVGIVSAQMLAYATGCALLAVDTFAALVRQVPAEAERVAVLADAQQDSVYVQEFGRADSAGDWRILSELAVLPYGRFIDGRVPTAWLTGPALQLWADRLPADVRRTDRDLWDVRVESLLEVGLERWRRGERDDPWKLEPLYARPSAAEQKWQERSVI